MLDFLTLVYGKICRFFFGMNTSEIRESDFCFVNDFIRPKVYPLRGGVDSLISSILFFGIICFSGVLKKYLQGSVPDTFFGIDIIIAPYFLFLLLFFIDDYSKVRVLNAESPCRSMGRYSLNVFTVILFGTSFVFFSFGEQYRNLGCFFLSLSFFCRALWGSKAHIEAVIWEKFLEKIDESDDDFIPLIEPFPKIFESNIWNLHRHRLKQVVVYSILYSAFFFLLWLLDILNLGVVDFLKSFKIDFLIINITFSENIQVPTILSLLLLVWYLYIERIRFIQDLKALKKLDFSKEQIQSENFSIASKSIIWMFPFYKRKLLKKVFQDD